MGTVFLFPVFTVPRAKGRFSELVLWVTSNDNVVGYLENHSFCCFVTQATHNNRLEVPGMASASSIDLAYFSLLVSRLFLFLVLCRCETPLEVVASVARSISEWLRIVISLA